MLFSLIRIRIMAEGNGIRRIEMEIRWVLQHYTRGGAERRSMGDTGK